MITINMDSVQFRKDMKNIVDYSIGFVEGVQKGKSVFFNNIGESAVDTLKTYIDSNARANPQALHHIYEWYRVGSPEARLFDINYLSNSNGIKIKTNLKQSLSVPHGSNTPFYNKANIMESGESVTITPRNSSVLVFEDNGETVFTKSPITIDNPGGDQVQGSFQHVLDTFFSKYFTQSFLRSSGVFNYMSNPTVYRNNLSTGKRGGRSVGMEVGYRWISKAGVKAIG
jgi:hypothetical protein